MGDRMFLFHGTLNAAGSKSKDLKSPTLNTPFFVTDLSEMAGFYGPGSMYVFTADRRRLKDKTWSLYNRSDFEKLRSKVPETAMMISMIREKLPDGNDTFFDVMYDVTEFIQQATDGQMVLKVDPGKIKFMNMDVQRQVLRSLVELGLADGFGKEEVRLGNALVMALKGSKTIYSNEFGFGAMGKSAVIRRVVKVAVFEEIYQMGFRAVMDGNTTGDSRYDRGHEFAIFDLNLLDSAWSVSVGKNDIKGVIDEISSLDH